MNIITKYPMIVKKFCLNRAGFLFFCIKNPLVSYLTTFPEKYTFLDRLTSNLLEEEVKRDEKSL